MVFSKETPSRLEPCLLDEMGPEIVDLVAALAGAAQSLGARLHPQTAAGLADLVRVMNCYYSNLIEGHNTTPREIESALANNLVVDEERRNLQIEARAHIRLQRDIDRLYQLGELPEPGSVSFISHLHRSFYQDAPETMLTIRGKNRELRMVQGKFRHGADEEVIVGRHLPPSADRVADFMAYFEQRYRLEPLGMGSRITAIAAAHHRLNYIHPFMDGNGRVSRLVSHAMVLKSGIGAHGLWSISRGLARGLESRSEYKTMMDHADAPRQGDLDGRGNLSARALADFTVWFLKICLDQVSFMTDLFALDSLVERLKAYVAIHNLRPEAFFILEQVLQRGELPRGEAARVTGLKERSARDLLASLVTNGVLGSDTPKGAVSLRSPLDTAEILFPRLFPVT